MLGEPLRHSKISEGGMIREKSKTFEVDERIAEHTQRVVFEDLDFYEFLCSPRTDVQEDCV